MDWRTHDGYLTAKRLVKLEAAKANMPIPPMIEAPSVGTYCCIDGQVFIGIAPEWATERKLDVSEMGAAIAHELGHIAHKDGERYGSYDAMTREQAHAMEFEADEFAVKLDGPNPVISLINKFDPYLNGQPSDTHPSIAQRIAHVRAMKP